MKPVSHGSIGRWRVGSGQVRRFEISRVGSGRVRRFSGEVGSGQQSFKSRGPGGFEPRGFQNLAGRVGSSQHT